jgi:preprotein translocase subunit SecG
METVVIVVHLMVIVAMVALVLLQRSEGGALGIGGGGFMSNRAQGNILTRSTAIMAAAFFATSIMLTVLAELSAPPSAILNEVPAATPPAEPQTAPASGQGILDQIQGMSKPTQTPAAGTSGNGTSGDGTSVPTTPSAPSAPTEPQVPTSQ